MLSFSAETNSVIPNTFHSRWELNSGRVDFQQRNSVVQNSDERQPVVLRMDNGQATNSRLLKSAQLLWVSNSQKRIWKAFSLLILSSMLCSDLMKFLEVLFSTQGNNVSRFLSGVPILFASVVLSECRKNKKHRREESSVIRDRLIVNTLRQPRLSPLVS